MGCSKVERMKIVLRVGLMIMGAENSAHGKVSLSM